MLRQQFSARNNLPGELDALSVAELAAESALTAAGYRNRIEAVRQFIPIMPAFSHTQHSKPIARGLQTATVVGPTADEIYTDELGRIKIQFHWARPQDHDQSLHGASADRVFY